MTTQDNIQPPATVVVVERKGNGLAVATLVLGILALLLAFLTVIGLVAVVFAIIAVGLGIGGIVVAVKRKAGMGMTIIGLALAVGSVFLALASTGAAVVAVDDAINEATVSTDEFTTEFGALENDGFSSSVDVTVTNVTDASISPWLTVTATSPNGSEQYGTADVMISDLAPEQSATESADFFEDIPSDAVFEVTDSL